MKTTHAPFSSTIKALSLAILLTIKCNGTFSGQAAVLFDESVPQLAFAATEIEAALKSSDKRVIELVVGRPAFKTPDVWFNIVSTGTQIRVIGTDATQAMYGGLEVAERIRLGEDVFAEGFIHREPFIKKRGIKFNIPLDARTPSYDDSGDAAQKNIAEMWNLEFWTEFLDQLARDRYNMLSLWNPHPFPSMIQSEQFPDVALEDVCVTTLIPNGRENEWGEPQLVSSNVIANVKVVKTMSIAKKI